MKASILIILLFITFCVFAQRPLEYEDISKENETYPLGKNTFAHVTISAKADFRPYFKSGDRLQTPAKTDTLGGKVYYHLHLDVPQPGTRKTVEINVSGFSPLDIPLVLDANRWYRYNIYDPDSTIVDCYNQLMREGMNLFTSGMYEEAQEKYLSVKRCSEIEDMEKVNKQITLIDSIQKWSVLADAAFARSDYSYAIKGFQHILENNPKDSYNRIRLIEAQQQQTKDCAALFGMAENYFEDKDYKSAKPLYEQVVEKSCNESSSALEKLQKIRSKGQLSHSLTYEYADNVPIGLSTGNYKEHKAGGYFTLRFNPDLFELIRTDGDEELKPELNVSFGWTLKVVKPVWIFFGPGYTGVGQYVYAAENINKEKDSTLKICSAISPEVGLLGKIPLGRNAKVGITLRYTFQYRFAIDKEYDEYIGKTKHVFGIGLCF
jgi:tetratricopeptide (TPR) repeat protein